ncbi:MAG: DNA polymerase III subunit delta [Pseudomonadota bacterium]|nr:DNA polymerase III subunit delta [Pseudomonadota bacterium]
MKVSVDNINSQLNKELASVYFITGDENLLVGEVKDKIRSFARSQGFDERETHTVDAKFNWDELRQSLNNLSLFSARRIIELDLISGSPGRDGSKAIINHLDNPPPDTLLIISAPKLDRRASKAKWAQKIEKQGCWVSVYSISPERLSGWLSHRMKKNGLKFETSAIDALATLVEGNLLAADQEIKKLALLEHNKTLTEEIILRAVADGARFDIFQLADAAINQDSPRAIRVFYGLKREGTPAPLVLWALIREINTLISLWSLIDQGEKLDLAMQNLRIWDSRKSMFRCALKNHDESSIRLLSLRSTLTDRVIKGAHEGKPWDSLLELLLLLVSPKSKLLDGYNL